MPPTSSPSQFSQLLLVEDNAPLARSLARFFRHSERAVTVAGSGGEVDTLGAHCFDVGIFDLELPDADGATLATRLLASGMVRRAIFYSGCSDHLRVERARAVGPVIKKDRGFHALLEALTQQAPSQAPAEAEGL